MANSQKIATIFGGSGFIGRHLIRRLTEENYRIVIATRSPYLSLFLKPLGNPGQIELIKSNIYDSDDIKDVLKHSNVAINLVGALYETKRQKFEYLHAQFPNILSNICNELGLKKLVHVSALGPKLDTSSQYMRSKLQGEEYVQNNFESSVILRPSVIFGPEDKFFNTFASLAQFSPVLPLIGGGKTEFQPVYVGDVAQAIFRSLEQSNKTQSIYELGGPSKYSFKVLMEILLKEIKKKRFLISIPFGMAKFQSYFFSLFLLIKFP